MTQVNTNPAYLSSYLLDTTLADYTRNEDVAKAIDDFYKRIAYVDSGRKYTREEMNER